MSTAFEPPVERRPPDGASRPVPMEEAFEVLANRRRRYVVHWLLEAGAGTELRQLSRQVAAWENGKPLDRVTAQERRRVYNALQQFHLPKLDDAGVVRYDADRGEIEPTEDLTSLRAYLDASRRSNRRRSRPLLAGGAALGTVVVLAGLIAFMPLPWTAIGVLSAAVAAGSIAAHYLGTASGTTDLRMIGTDD